MDLSYEVYRYIFIGAAILCGVMFIVSIFLFVFLRIPQVIGDLSGLTAKKAIENIREQNEKSGDKTYKTSAVNLERGRVTDKISQSGRLEERSQMPFATGIVTSKISTQQLSNAPETDVLTNMSQMVADNTTVLTQASMPMNVFEIEFDITYIHSNEIIM